MFLDVLLVQVLLRGGGRIACVGNSGSSNGGVSNLVEPESAGESDDLLDLL